MTVDFGTDLSLQDDVSPEFPEVTGLDVLRNACVRRLSTPQGDLFYDPAYGYDLTGMLSDSYTPSDIARMQTDIVRQLELDEMIDGASCTVSNVTFESMNVDILIRTALGPFSMTLEINNVSVKVLQAFSG